MRSTVAGVKCRLEEDTEDPGGIPGTRTDEDMDLMLGGGRLVRDLVFSTPRPIDRFEEVEEADDWPCFKESCSSFKEMTLILKQLNR